MVENGDRAVVHVVATDADGEVFETTDIDVALGTGVYDAHRDYVPLEFEVGAGEVPPAIDEAVREMDVGEERTVTAEPERAFGRRRDDAVVEVDRAVLEDRSDVEPEVGAPVGTDDGRVGWVTAVDDDAVVVDFNHEYAGDRVEFEVRLLAVEEGEAAEAPSDDRGA